MMPTGPDCDMTFDQCVQWAEQQDGIDDPAAWCGAREQECEGEGSNAKVKASRKFWSMRAAADDPGIGELMLYGGIGPDDGMGWAFDEVSPKAFRADLDGLGDISELRVYINSPGGDVFAGQAIHSMLQRHRATVTVYIDGLAASIASVVAMAGDRVIMPSNAMMMVHNPWTVGMGDAEEFRKLADTLDQIRESLLAAYESKTGMSRDELLPILDAETWMTAAEAVEMGFADEIEESKKVAASMRGGQTLVVNGQTIDLSRYQHAPKPAAMFGGVATTDGQTYAEQGASVLEALSAFEQRTQQRKTSREKAGRVLSDADLSRWRQIQDMASRVLGHTAQADTTEQVEIEYQRMRAILHGMDA